MWTCDYPGELGMSGNEKGASKTMKVLAVETTMSGGYMVERPEIDRRH